MRKFLLLPLILIALSASSSEGYNSGTSSSAYAHFMMAVVYEDRGSLEDAYAEYLRVLEYDHENPTIYIKLALIDLKNNRIEKSVANLNKAGDYASSDIRIHFVLALIYSSIGKYDKAA